MSKKLFILIFLIVAFLFTGCTIKNNNKNLAIQEEGSMPKFKNNKILLPKPATSGEVSLEETIQKRRSRRDYTDKPLTINQIAQILWAGQGITNQESGFRSAPSAGALYPLEIYLVAGEGGIEDLETGVYHFNPQEHSLLKVDDKDLRKELSEAALGQVWIAKAPVNIVMTAIFSRTTSKYGDRGRNYVYMEAGHAAQNICLQVEALSLGTVTVGAFYDEGVKKLLGLTEEEPLYIMPIGND